MTGTAQSTRMFRADLTGFGLGRVGAIRIEDSNSKSGGSPGIYSGLDLDAIFLDRDGSRVTRADRIVPDRLRFDAGALRPGGVRPPSRSGGPTSGSTSETEVDEAFATLGRIDGIFFESGSLTRGDGGALTALFAPGIGVESSLFLFVGEVSGGPAETVTGLVEVSAAVPLPAALPMMLPGLLGLGFLARRRTTS